jgi:hypothetical protein
VNRTGKMVFTKQADEDHSYVKTIRLGLSWIHETVDEYDNDFIENEPIGLDKHKVKINNLCEIVPDYLHRKASEAMQEGWLLSEPPTMDAIYRLRVKLNSDPKSNRKLVDAIKGLGGATWANEPRVQAFDVLHTRMVWSKKDDDYYIDLLAERNRLLQLWILLDHGIHGPEQMELWGRDPIDPQRRIGSRHRGGPLVSIKGHINWIAANIRLDEKFRRWMDNAGLTSPRRPVIQLATAFPDWQFAM